MEDLYMKENLPQQGDNEALKLLKLSTSTPREHLKSFNMSTSTPRQPLMDLKQVARPETALSSLPIKSITPLGTPRPLKSQRKMKPSSLLKNPDKENVTTQNSKMRSTDTFLKAHRMDEIFEENVEEFVTKVLDQCVQDLKEEENFTSNTEHNDKQCTVKDENSNVGLEKSDPQNKSSTTQLADDTSKKDAEIESVSAEGVRTVGRHELVSQFGDLSVSEDSLLGDSHYSDCSFTESTKSEEELLASYVQTPNLKNDSEGYANGTTDEINELENCESRDEAQKIQTPRPTFLEKVAVMQRVRNATSSLASWVFPKETMEHHVQRIPSDDKIKIVHDVACSPMPQNRKLSSLVDNLEDDHNNSGTSVDEVANTGSSVDKLEIHSHDDHLHLNTSTAVSQNVLYNENNESEACEEILQEKETVTEVPVDIELGLPKDVSGTCESYVSTPSKEEICRDFGTNTDLSLSAENAAMRSIACSPISIPVCDFSVQNEVETQSVLCSPIRFENHDVSIQNEAEMHSMICSPIRFQGNDVAIQNEVEMCSVMCSPIPMQVHDVSVQNQIDTRSIMCSPMVPCPSEDKGILVTGPEVTDTGIMTDEKESKEIGVHIQPDVRTVCTEMEENPMTNSSTSMTPLKIDKKQGRKLTAEDVRKQHPRVLANELETLRLQNSRLETQVQRSEKDRKKLVAQEELQGKLEETRASLQESETRYTKDTEEWQTKYNTLETEISVLKSEHDNEIGQVRAEYESNDYREHFYASQKLVQELQTEIDQYSALVDDIEKAQNLQGQLECAVSDSFNKIRSKAEWIRKQQSDFQIKNDSLQKQLAEYQADKQILEQDQLAIQKEREQMAEIVRSCKENMLEVDSQLEKTSAELGATKETVLVMREEIDTVSTEKEEVRAQNEELVKQNETLQTEVDRLSEEIKGLNSTSKQQEAQLNSLNKSLTEAAERLQNEMASHKSGQEKKMLVVKNLERTLENRESEIDLLERDLFECREIIYTQMEAAKTHDAKEKEMTAELTTLRTECNRLKDCCANLRAKEQDARSTLKSTQEELTGTQEYASEVMKQQGTEIADCSSAVDELVDHMTSVLANLSRRAGIENIDGESSIKTVTMNPDVSKGSKNTQISLVSQILDAAKTFGENVEKDRHNNENQDIQTGCENSEKTEKQSAPSRVDALAGEQLVVDSPGALSRKKLGFSGNSAFAPVKSSKSLQTQQTEKNSGSVKSGESSESSLHIKNSKPESLNNRFSHKVESKFEGVCHVSQEGGLTNQMVRVTELFTEITRMAHLIEKALRSSLNDVTFENEDFSSRVNQCEYSERRLQAELQVTQTELGKSKNMVEQLNGKLQEMSEKFESMLDQGLEIKRVQEEISRLRGKYQAVEAENELLNEQITELLQRMETVTAPGSKNGSAVDVESQRQVIALKKKVEKYRAMLNEKDKMVEQISAKASSRINKLETNWKKADAEVCRFDELVDTVRAVLVDNKTAMEDKQLTKLIELIDGQEQLSAFDKERKQAALKPVKTARW